jgi:hypothetical protein
MTKRHWGAVTIAADRPLKAVAEELNIFLAPQTLVETDLFDEVPGYIASAEGLEFSLQGSPADAEDNDYYYFDFLCEMVGPSSLPGTLSNLPVEASRKRVCSRGAGRLCFSAPDSAQVRTWRVRLSKLSASDP